MPDFAVKQDAIPGFINEAWTRVEQPGIYRGQCTELCGMNHAFMPVVVEVRPEEEFLAWIEDQRIAGELAGAAAVAGAAAPPTTDPPRPPRPQPAGSGARLPAGHHSPAIESSRR